MSTSVLTVRAYDGSRMSLEPTGRTRLVPGAIGPEKTGIMADIIDRQGRVVGASFDGKPARLIGHGTLQAKVPMIGLGDPFPVVVFVAGAMTYLGFPDGQPVIGPSITCELRLFQSSAATPMPLGLSQGTRVRTPLGDPRIECLAPGDTVVDHVGHRHRIRWIGHRDLVIPLGLSPRLAAWLPLRILAGAFGEGRPYVDVILSRQHRILMQGTMVEQILDEPAVLAKAEFLTGDLVKMATEFRTIRFYHILCDRHVILLANGLPVESLLPGDVLAEGVGRPVDDPLDPLFPHLMQVTWKAAGCDPAARIVGQADARLINSHRHSPDHSVLRPAPMREATRLTTSA